jgi:all-trans-8'-apo-beta-carotenal 15,15'-oxygenase
MQAILASAYAEPAVEQPEPVPLEVLEGTVPADLSGVVLRNGPGRHGRGGVRYGHPFDGDGFLQRLVFDDGEARYSARYVQTREFRDEEAAGHIVHRGFGTNRPGGLRRNALSMRFKNAANTSVVQHAGHTLALWEGGLPHAVDAVSLATHGRFDYGGRLQNPFGRLERLVNPELPFSAHPSICPRTGELWNFGTAYGRRNRLLVYRVTPDGALTRRVVETDDLPFIHDFVLTERYAVFAAPAVTFDIARTLLGLSTPVDSLRLRDAPGTAIVVPRDGGEVRRIPLEPGFVFHWANAWETAGGLVLDGLKYPGFPDLDDMDALCATERPELLAHLTRITLDLDAGTARETRRCAHPMELPTRTGTGEDAVLYGVAGPIDRRHPFLSGLIRVPPRGEPTFVDYGHALPGEPLPIGDWLVTQAIVADDDSLRSEVWIVHPETLAIQARLKVPSVVPPPLHGTVLDG